VLKRRELEKAAWERRKFRAAAELAGLQIVLRSIRSRRHPEPDILCTLRNGERVAFELVELVDPDIARIESTLSNEGVWYARDHPTLRNLRKHLVENEYISKHPMELIAFAGDALGPRNVWVPTHDNNLIQDWLDQSPFRRLRVVNLGRREPGVWLDRVREP